MPSPTYQTKATENPHVEQWQRTQNSTTQKPPVVSHNWSGEFSAIYICNSLAYVTHLYSRLRRYTHWKQWKASYVDPAPKRMGSPAESAHALAACLEVDDTTYALYKHNELSLYAIDRRLAVTQSLNAASRPEAEGLLAQGAYTWAAASTTLTCSKAIDWIRVSCSNMDQRQR